jgi:hypothetical protein
LRHGLVLLSLCNASLAPAIPLTNPPLCAAEIESEGLTPSGATLRPCRGLNRSSRDLRRWRSARRKMTPIVGRIPKCVSRKIRLLHHRAGRNVGKTGQVAAADLFLGTGDMPLSALGK